jgi:peptidoglycan L-alanyl-D-glutamate endopeptidase CwlK
MYFFGEKSINQLSTCHPDLQLIMNTAIKISDIDFSIIEGYRTLELQEKYYNEGASKVQTGKHNLIPSMAVDICPYINGLKWNYEHFTYLAGLIHGITEMLLKEGKITHRIRWGGNWDMDGTILIDQSFDDRPHFELINAN